MKAIGFIKHLPINYPEIFFEFDAPKPKAKGHDLLVKINAISVNPVDTYVRGLGHTQLKHPKIIGWDACGTVEDIGDKVSLFKKGDRVYYAGSFKRPGSDSEYQLVDERIVGHAPHTLKDFEAAALPLTSLTAYEALFEQLNLNIGSLDNSSKTILIINGAGGVGSIATQLAHLAGLKVISTASRPESIKWTKQHGADLIVNHRQDLVRQIHQLGFKYVDYILGLSNLDAHWKEICELVTPNGHIASVTENKGPINLRLLTKKRGHFAWEWMYSKSYFHTSDMQTQHEILDKIATMIDQQQLKCTLTKHLSPINVQNLQIAHKLIESGHMIGKVTLSNWHSN